MIARFLSARESRRIQSDLETARKVQQYERERRDELGPTLVGNGEPIIERRKQ